jgi:hypothetical protein
MIKKIFIHYDENGQRLYEDKVRILTPEMVNSSYFTLNTCDDDCIQICRYYLEPENDSWNDGDKRLCSIMFTMQLPKVKFYSREITIAGFENPSISNAGILMPAYQGCNPCKNAIHANEKEWRKLDLMDWSFRTGSLRPQFIELFI